jgi:hypothetical protein
LGIAFGRWHPNKLYFFDPFCNVGVGASGRFGMAIRERRRALATLAEVGGGEAWPDHSAMVGEGARGVVAWTLADREQHVVVGYALPRLPVS